MGWGRVSQAPPGKEIPGGGALKQKCPPLGGMDIFWNYTYVFLLCGINVSYTQLIGHKKRNRTKQSLAKRLINE